MTFGLRKKPEPVEAATSEAVVANVPVLTAVERRADHRRRVLKGGNIFFNKGYGAYDCQIRNLSDGGALINMEDSSGLPGVFDFAVSGEDERRSATISWRKRGMAGVKFL